MARRWAGVGIVALWLQDGTGFPAGRTQLIFDAFVFALALFLFDWAVVAWSLLGAVIVNQIVTVNHKLATLRASSTKEPAQWPPRRPFSRYEFFIAWRYLRARRAEGGVSVMTWISFPRHHAGGGGADRHAGRALGLSLRIRRHHPGRQRACQRLRSGGGGRERPRDRTLENYAEVADAVRVLPGVTHAAPVVRGQVMATNQGRNAGVEVIGIAPEDLHACRWCRTEVARGDIGRFSEGIAIGSGVARELGVGWATASADLARRGAHALRHQPARVNAYEVVYIFRPGAGTSTAPASTCRSPRRSPISTATAWPTRSR
jgi:hypothetical protein